MVGHPGISYTDLISNNGMSQLEILKTLAHKFKDFYGCWLLREFQGGYDNSFDDTVKGTDGMVATRTMLRREMVLGLGMLPSAGLTS